jgi:hypothetical protein
VGKTAFGHLGDMRFQGFGGNEDLHDLDLPHYIHRVGLDTLLQAHGFQPADVIFPPKKDFIECDAPRINTDRLDYTLRERRRYHMAPERMVNWTRALKLVQGEIVFANPELAAMFARGNLVLPVMNWQEPAHKLNMRLLLEMVNRISVRNMQLEFGYPSTSYHPYDAMYSHDEDFISTTATSDEFLWTVRPIADTIGRDMRRIYLGRALDEVGAIMHGALHDFDQMRYGGMPSLPPNLEMVDSTGRQPQEVVPDFQTNPYTVDFHLPHLKPRKALDPWVACPDGDIRPLSELDPNYDQLADSTRRRITASQVIRLLVGRDTKAIIERGIAQNEQGMPNLLARPPMPDAIFRQAIASFAPSHKKVDLLWAVER